jgi:hypothetical protein
MINYQKQWQNLKRFGVGDIGNGLSKAPRTIKMSDIGDVDNGLSRTSMDYQEIPKAGG